MVSKSSVLKPVCLGESHGCVTSTVSSLGLRSFVLPALLAGWAGLFVSGWEEQRVCRKGRPETRILVFRRFQPRSSHSPATLQSPRFRSMLGAWLWLRRPPLDRPGVIWTLAPRSRSWSTCAGPGSARASCPRGRAAAFADAATRHPFMGELRPRWIWDLMAWRECLEWRGRGGWR